MAQFLGGDFPGHSAYNMNQLLFPRLAVSSAFCAALVGCASTEDSGPPPVIRTAAPKGYEKTINDFFAFRIRGPQDNAVIGVGPPEQGACPLDGYSTSSRGWVVPAVYETRTREPSGQGAVSVTSKQYYFWFLGNTIAGISPRIDLCPGVGVTFGEDASPKQVAQGSATATAPGGQKQEEANKASAAPAVARKSAKKPSAPASAPKGKAEPAKQTRTP